MKSFTNYLAAAAAIGGLSAPLAAQNSDRYGTQQYPQSYPQTYPQQGASGYSYPQSQSYPQGYPNQQGYPSQQGYGYQQSYGNQQNYGNRQDYGYQQGYSNQQVTGSNPIGQIIDQLVGNRYNVSDRAAVRECASAAIAQASGRYGGGYANDPRYAQTGNMGLRVSSITQVQRQSSGLRVSGVLSSADRRSQNAYGNRSYNRGGNISFRCNVDYRGQVSNVRLGGGMGYRGS